MISNTQITAQPEYDIQFWNAMRNKEAREDILAKGTLSEKHSGNIQLINNSDKGSGNTLQLSSQATENKSKVHSI